MPTKKAIERVAATADTGSGAAKGMEFAMVLMVFFGLGWVIDRVIGTTPWIAIAMLVLGVIGQFARIWYAYDAEMRHHEQRMQEARRR